MWIPPWFLPEAISEVWLAGGILLCFFLKVKKVNFNSSGWYSLARRLVFSRSSSVADILSPVQKCFCKVRSNLTFFEKQLLKSTIKTVSFWSSASNLSLSVCLSGLLRSTLYKLSVVNLRGVFDDTVIKLLTPFCIPS